MSKAQGSRAFHNARLRKQRKKQLENANDKFSQAVTLHQRGLVASAQALYREILQVTPDHFDSLYFLGVSEFQSGQYEQAGQLLEDAIKIEPKSAAAHSTRAAILYALGRHDAAIASCERALAIDPNDADALNFLGNALAGLGLFEEAVSSYDKAIALKADFVGALNNRGNALKELKRFEEALASFDRAISIEASYAEAFNNRGNVLKELARYADAIADYDRAIAIQPTYADAYANRGIALLELSRHDEALISLDKALAIIPSHPGALNARGNALRGLVRFDEALASFDKAISTRPDFAEAFSNRGIVLTELMRFGDAIASFDEAIAIKPDSAIAISNKITHLDFAAIGFEKQQEARKVWWQNIGSKIAASATLGHDNVRDPGRRIVLGYVSSDFREHSAAVTIRPILRHHDRAKFHVICYSCSIVEDDVTKDLQRLTGAWRNASRSSDEDLVRWIRDDKVDILIDLSGHSAGNRLGVFARKPAPIQVTAWGHATGTGLPTIDFLFSDAVAIPAAVRPLFAERIYDLPCLVTVEHPPDALRSGNAPVLFNDYVTFGVFNRISKISDAAIEVWARILHATPSSRLLIKDVALDNEFARERLKDKFAAHAISGDRIDLLGRTSRDDHLRAFKDVDICLDPFPWGGGVSTWEALHMGVPVVAMLGNGVSSRVAGAISSSIGLNEWVAETTEDYLSIAVNFASQPGVLARLRHELPRRISNSAAGDCTAYVRAVEDAYRTMWENYCQQNA